MSSGNSEDWGVPHLPACQPMSVDGQSLGSIRDTLSSMQADIKIEQAITSVITAWKKDPQSVEPITRLREVLDTIRILPRGEERLAAMNTFVRTLGQPEALATLLDMLRDSSGRKGTREEELTRLGRSGTKHAVYGWAGQTLLFMSDSGQSAGTVVAEPRILELLGETETPGLWALAMHVWQPNPNASGFSTGAPIDPGTIVEPPHSHPFDFTSMVSAGIMRQSIYAHRPPGGPASGAGTNRVDGRYDGVSLEHVDDTWPEHVYRASCNLETLESRVPLAAGNSYLLPTDMIHDVEFDTKVARETPAITLFLASEAVVVAHVYMASSMADAHDADPDLRKRGRALSETAWQEKMKATSAYLRGEQPTLCLDSIVNHKDSYAFFHKA